MWQATSVISAAGEEPHMAGLMAWNGVNRNLDYLFLIDLKRGLAQERGTYAAAPDGSIVREVTATYDPAAGPGIGPAGATQQFRQTFTPAGEGRMLTSLLRKTASGWAPAFPGSDHLLMVRRAGS